jgi:hypothetical protein
MSFRTLAADQKAAFIAGQCAARRDAWMKAAREAVKNGRKNMARLAVAFARENSAHLVRLVTRARSVRKLQEESL